MNSASPEVTRFAPSPTGSLHLGNARTALFSYLWARKAGGHFILRIEDTDAVRSESRHQQALMEELRWLGLCWDEGPDIGGPSAPYCQAERGAIYRDLFERLETEQHAYPCFCTPEELDLSRKLQRMAAKPPRYAGTCRDLSREQRAARIDRGLTPTLRFAEPPGRVVKFLDTVHGPQSFLSDDIGDFIIRREDGTAAFFFCNAVDDSLMGITQVLRGDDHLANTPRQLLILEALKMRQPGYGHVGLLTGADGLPLSKRHGSASVQEFRERGFLGLSIINHLFHLGHTADVDGWLPLESMPRHFCAEHLGRAPARFDETQLLHWQKETLSRMAAPDIARWLGAGDEPEFVELIRHNVVLPADAVPWRAAVRGELAPLGETERGVIAEAGPQFFEYAAEAFDQAAGDLKTLTQILKERTGRKGAALFMPLRVALTGQAHGPELAPLLRMMPPTTARARLKSHAKNP